MINSHETLLDLKVALCYNIKVRIEPPLLGANNSAGNRISGGVVICQSAGSVDICVERMTHGVRSVGLN